MPLLLTLPNRSVKAYDEKTKIPLHYLILIPREPTPLPSPDANPGRTPCRRTLDLAGRERAGAGGEADAHPSRGPCGAQFPPSRGSREPPRAGASAGRARRASLARAPRRAGLLARARARALGGGCGILAGAPFFPRAGPACPARGPPRAGTSSGRRLRELGGACTDQPRWEHKETTPIGLLKGEFFTSFPNFIP